MTISTFLLQESTYSLLKVEGKGKYSLCISFLAPFVAASYLLLNKAKKGYDLSSKSESLKSKALDLGLAGKDKLFGYGLITLPKEC